MFFDAPKEDTTYCAILMDIARKQQELLSFRFDRQARTLKNWPPKGLFGTDKKAVAWYNDRLAELEQLKAKAAAHRKAMGYKSGTFWWNLPWEQVEEYMIADLLEDTGDGAWRFQYDWVVQEEEDCRMLYLKEEGHCSCFDSNSHTEFSKVSKYSEGERASMVRDFNNRQTAYDCMNMMMYGDSLVRSVESGKVYDSYADYMLSSEYTLNRMVMSNYYEKSLYREYEKQEVTAISNSRHYTCVYAVAAFHIGASGMPDRVECLNYRFCGGKGADDEDLKEQYAHRDAMVGLAAYLADSRDVKAVPMQLFGRDVLEGARDYQEAMRQAELYTCLADKLKLLG